MLEVLISEINPDTFINRYITILLVIGVMYLFVISIRTYLMSSKTTKITKELKTIEKEIDPELSEEQKVSRRFYLFNDWLDNQGKYSMPTVFMESWKRYYKAFSDQSSSGSNSYVPDVYDFIKEEQFVNKYGFRKIAEAVPAIFVSFGILGTFIGLTSGITGLNPEGATTAELRVGIDELIAGMKLAFSSSIVAIVISVIIQLADKAMIYPSLIKSFKRVRDSLDEAFPFKEEASLLEEMVYIQKNHMEDMKTFLADELVTKITTGFNDVMVNGLNPHLEKTNEIMEKMVVGAAETQNEKMNEMVDHFVNSLSEITGDHMKELGNALNKTVEWQEKVYNEMNSLVKELNDSASKQAEMVEKTTGLTDQMSTFAGQLSEYQESIQQTMAELSTATEKNKELQEQTGELLETVIEERKVSTEQFGQQMEKLQENIEGLVSQSSVIKDLQVEMQNSISQFHKTTDLVKGLTDANLALSDSVNNQVLLNTESNEKLEGVLSKFQNNSEIFADMQGSMNELFNAITDERSQIDEKTKEQIKYLQNTFSSVETQINALKEYWAESSEHLNENRELFSELNHRLEGSMDQFAEHMYQGLDRTFTQFDKQLGDAVKYLDRGVSSLRSVVEDMTDDVEKISGTVKQFNKNIELVAATKQ